MVLIVIVSISWCNSAVIYHGEVSIRSKLGHNYDVCISPHISDRQVLTASSLIYQWKASSSYFLGDQANDSLQRIYGISFPDTKQLTEYKAFLAEAAKRDHRKIGKVRIWFISPSCFRIQYPFSTRSKNFSFSTSSVPGAASFCLMVLGYITLWLSSSG